jgi:hypothetical protein
MRIDIRQDIINQLTSESKHTGYLDELKRSLKLTTEEGNNLEQWFKGCIESLYFRCNTSLLALHGNHGVGKTNFLRTILPESLKKYYIEVSDTRMLKVFHEYFIINFEAGTHIGRMEIKYLLTCAQKVMFRADIDQDGYPLANKRLASLATTTNDWRHSSGRRTCVLDFSAFDWQIYNAINKQYLWMELFQKYGKK